MTLSETTGTKKRGKRKQTAMQKGLTQFRQKAIAFMIVFAFYAFFVWNWNPNWKIQMNLPCTTNKLNTKIVLKYRFDVEVLRGKGKRDEKWIIWFIIALLSECWICVNEIAAGAMKNKI